MDARRRLASLVLESGWSVAAAARESGVSRQTAHAWVARARAEGLAEMAELSRRPRSSPRETPPGVVERALALAAERPHWGPRKLHALLWPGGEAPITERTLARVLARSGRRVSAQRADPAATARFERELPNELWQADFKRVGHKRSRSDALSVIDDASRFCVSLRSLPDQGLESAWGALWAAFGEFGLPLSVLTDNGQAFRNNATWRFSSFDLRLMLLGVRPAHGRPYHPQTQGKVERFHGTLEREASFEAGQDPGLELSAFRDLYNWVRPHEALGQRTPGSAYSPSPRPRPERMPEPFFPAGATLRRAQEQGYVSYKGQTYKLGRAFQGLPVGLLEEGGRTMVVWGAFTLAPLADFKV